MVTESGLPTVAQIRAELAGVLGRFRAGQTRAFSFGDGVPEAVVATYDEFEDLGGEAKFDVGDVVRAPEAVAERLIQLVEGFRTGSMEPVVWGEEGEPEAVLLSTAQYRQLRGDDQPPPGVIDDPTKRTYATEPLPGSHPFDMDEWAATMGPETQQILAEIRREDGEIP